VEDPADPGHCERIVSYESGGRCRLLRPEMLGEYAEFRILDDITIPSGPSRSTYDAPRLCFRPSLIGLAWRTDLGGIRNRILIQGPKNPDTRLLADKELVRLREEARGWHILDRIAFSLLLGRLRIGSICGRSGGVAALTNDG
jgi:hypothetical protein